MCVGGCVHMCLTVFFFLGVFAPYLTFRCAISMCLFFFLLLRSYSLPDAWLADLKRKREHRVCYIITGAGVHSHLSVNKKVRCEGNEENKKVECKGDDDILSKTCRYCFFGKLSSLTL